MVTRDNQIAHKLVALDLEAGETIEGYGYTPEDVVETKDVSDEYSVDGRLESRLRVWVWKGITVDE